MEIAHSEPQPNEAKNNVQPDIITLEDIAAAKKVFKLWQTVYMRRPSLESFLSLLTKHVEEQQARTAHEATERARISQERLEKAMNIINKQ